MKTKLLICMLALSGIANAQWQQTNFPISGGGVTCIAFRDTNIFVGSWNNGLFLSTNDGVSWTWLHNGLPNLVTALAISDTNIFAGTWGLGIFLSTNNGTSWNAVDTTFSTSAGVSSLAISDTNIFAGTGGNGVYFSNNNGTIWTAVNTGLTTWINTLLVNGTNIYAGTESGSAVYVSANNGISWTALPSFFCCVNGLVKNGTNIVAGTIADGMFLSTNNGSSWLEVNSGLPKVNVTTVVAIRALINNGTTLIAGTDSGVYVSSNNGTSWEVFNDGLTYPNISVSTFGINGTTIFAGIGGTVWKRPLSEMESGINEINVDNSMTIFPNPFSTQTTLHADKILKYATLSVYNSFGQEIKQIKNISGQTITFHRDILPSGLYFIRLTQDNKTIATDKLIIIDK